MPNSSKKEPMIDADILRITRRNGCFNVSLRWRDIPLQKQCNRLVKEGKLVKVGRVKREIRYILPIQPLPMLGDSVQGGFNAIDALGDLNASYTLAKEALIGGTGAVEVKYVNGEIIQKPIKKEDIYL